ncbi:LytTR family DNA-binding domain-containing protein [Larkinella arboricola]|nr:LytTR family DNA-binding domain-containing protein [Larkinella arboricola]
MNSINQRSVDHVRLGMLTLTIGAHADWIPVHQIVRVEGAGNYSRIYTQSGQVYLVAVTLQKVGERLVEFWRAHKSHLVNPDYIRLIRKSPQGRFAHLTTGEAVPVARRVTRYPD